MFELICQKLIPNHENVSDEKVRQKYGEVFSVISIILNSIMVIFKLMVSFITFSVSIRADALNNLSDVGSNLAALIGFRLSNKHADADHPYGHGRYEYLSGLFVAVLILYVGISSAVEAIKKIISPEELVFSASAVVVLSVSVLIKFVMSLLNKKAGEKISSDTLKAAGKDSENDAVTTLTTLVALAVFAVTKVNIDIYLGLAVSLIVIKSGFDTLMDVLGTILGKAPQKEEIREIEDFINSFGCVMGIHDLMIHDYGPSHRFMTLHVEVDKDVDTLVVHDEVDNIENECLEKFGILTTIHMDPVDTKDEKVKELKEVVLKAVKEIDPAYMIHDFRIVSGPTHTNLVFDVVVPANEKKSPETVKKEISERIKKIDPSYFCVIRVDQAYA